MTEGSIASGAALALLELDGTAPAGSPVAAVVVDIWVAVVAGFDGVVGAATGSEGDADLKPPRDCTTPNVTAPAVAMSANPTNQPARRRREPSSSGGASMGASDGEESPVTVD